MASFLNPQVYAKGKAGKGRSGDLVLTMEWENLSQLNAFRLGMLQGSNAREFNRVLGIATLNAARKMRKPVQAAAPVAALPHNGRAPGTLKASVTARGARYNRPAALVGISPGKRGRSGAWYRNMVTSGVPQPRTAKNGGNRGTIAANDFVRKVTSQMSVQADALRSMNDTVLAYLNGKLPLRASKWKRKG